MVEGSIGGCNAGFGDPAAPTTHASVLTPGDNVCMKKLQADLSVNSSTCGWITLRSRVATHRGVNAADTATWVPVCYDSTMTPAYADCATSSWGFTSGIDDDNDGTDFDNWVEEIYLILEP